LEDYSDIIPEDVLEEVLREEEEERKGKSKRNYPSARDIAEAVIEAARMARGVSPDDFPDLVYQLLEERGFDTSKVTVKRIWRTYETLARRGIIPDTLGVLI
jgi:hypothetical protein